MQGFQIQNKEEEIIITINRKFFDINVLENILKPYLDLEQRERIFGNAKGKYQLSNDFDEPLEDFKDYMEHKV